MLAVVLVSPALADPVPAASVATASGPVAAAAACPELSEDSRERPVQHDGCVLALPPEAIDVPRHTHPLLAVEIALLQFFGYGVLVGGIAKLAGRRFWIWFLVGLLLRQVLVAVQHLPFLG